MPDVHDDVPELPPAFRLGEWSVDPMLNRISRDGRVVQLRPRAMDVLVFLSRRPGEVASKTELIDSIWRTEFVTENALTHVISELRTELGDEARNPSYIENIPRRGYRLIAEVSPERSADPQSAEIVPLHPITKRSDTDPEAHPYPGLSAFGESDAAFFFGRDVEVTRMWRALTARRLLALIGPSGVGKSSFLQAGVIPSTPEGWGVIICQPGASPFVALARALVPEFSGDVEATAELFDIRDGRGAMPRVSRWREHHRRALLIVDQFEELFTLCPGDTRASFINLLGRLVEENGLNVLLSLRDDFLHRCHRYEVLRPIFDQVTVLDTPPVKALLRALIEPARSLGYDFDDETMAEEMVAEVKSGRGALPLLAFAAAQLWERRERQNRLLTRRAYEDIGGVSGALARHAEETMAAIGPDCAPMVRELFRNLVTAENTRAVRERGELLSVFSDEERSTGADVIQRLIDARLLTSYEERKDEDVSTCSIEIVHESLLTNWPRLVRWRSQDADGARFREALRQAARTWDERGHNRDLLWTGSAYREFQVWRDNYPGGLTEVEEAFGSAMTSLASRQQVIRRTVVAAGFVTLLAVLVVVGGLWRQSVRETRRAEAAKLLALGQIAFADERTAGLAYSIASLELSDTPEARRLALESLWAGPPATVVNDRRRPWWIAFSPDGGQMAFGDNGGIVRICSQRGEPPVKLDDFRKQGMAVALQFSPDSRRLVGWGSDAGPQFRVWDASSGETEQVIAVPGAQMAWGYFEPEKETILSVGFKGSPVAIPSTSGSGQYVVHRWPVDGGEPQFVGWVQADFLPAGGLDVSRGLFGFGRGKTLFLHRLENLGREAPTAVGRWPDAFGFNSRVAFDPFNDRLALSDAAGNLLVWPLNGSGNQPDRRLETAGDPTATAFSPDGRLLAHSSRSGMRLWDLQGPVGAEGVSFGGGRHIAFSPDGRWLATASYGLGLAMWPMTNPYARILGEHGERTPHMAFSADGSRLFTQGHNDGLVLSWDLGAGAGLEPEVVFKTTPQWGWGLDVDARDRFLIVGTLGGTWRVPLDGSEPVKLEGFPRQNCKLDPSGRYLAGNVWADHTTEEMHVLDLETGTKRVFETPGDGNVRAWDFDHNGQLVVTRGGVLSRWSPETGVSDVLLAEKAWGVRLSPDRRFLLGWIEDSSAIFDLEGGNHTPLELPDGESFLGNGPSGLIIVTATKDGEIFVRPVEDPKSHLLLGHDKGIGRVAISPDGKWIASADFSGAIRLWPMPDFSKPPLHTLPHEELMAKLESLTNLRVVPDDKASTGYSVEADMDAYRGWETVPDW